MNKKGVIKMTTDKLEVFFDGSCSVCAQEMNHYRRRDKACTLEFIDISAPRFEAHLHGQSLERFMARLHVKSADGTFFTGVDAFAEIWRRLPGIHLDLFAAGVQLPGVHLLATLGYELFAWLRPWLPRRNCEEGHCHFGTMQSRH